MRSAKSPWFFCVSCAFLSWLMLSSIGWCTYWPLVCLGGDLLLAFTLWWYSNHNLYGTTTHFKSVPFTFLSLDSKHLLSYKCYFLGLQNSLILPDFLPLCQYSFSVTFSGPPSNPGSLDIEGLCQLHGGTSSALSSYVGPWSPHPAHCFK